MPTLATQIQRKSINSDDYVSLLQSKRIVRKTVHLGIVITTFSDGSFAENLHGQAFAFCPSC